METPLIVGDRVRVKEHALLGDPSRPCRCTTTGLEGVVVSVWEDGVKVKVEVGQPPRELLFMYRPSDLERLPETEPEPDAFAALLDALEGDPMVEGEAIGLGALPGTIAVLLDFDKQEAQAIRLDEVCLTVGPTWLDMATWQRVPTVDVLAATSEGRARLIYEPGMELPALLKEESNA